MADFLEAIGRSGAIPSTLQAITNLKQAESVQQQVEFNQAQASREEERVKREFDFKMKQTEAQEAWLDETVLLHLNPHFKKLTPEEQQMAIEDMGGQGIADITPRGEGQLPEIRISRRNLHRYMQDEETQRKFIPTRQQYIEKSIEGIDKQLDSGKLKPEEVIAANKQRETLVSRYKELDKGSSQAAGQIINLKGSKGEKRATLINPDGTMINLGEAWTEPEKMPKEMSDKDIVEEIGKHQKAIAELQTPNIMGETELSEEALEEIAERRQFIKKWQTKLDERARLRGKGKSKSGNTSTSGITITRVK